MDIFKNVEVLSEVFLNFKGAEESSPPAYVVYPGGPVRQPCYYPVPEQIEG